MSHRSAPRTVGRGPAALGRLLLVAAGAPAPDEWSSAPRIDLGPDPAAAVDRLRHLIASRTSAVIEVGIDPAPTPRTVDRRAPHEAGVTAAFPADDLAVLLHSAAIDARTADVRWAPLDAALALGARPVVDGRGDVELPDGTRAWIDGAPTRFTPPIDGVAVVHRTAIEHGSLAPLRTNGTDGRDLADDQAAAVAHEGGAARIIAPAGSGKTRVLTERARQLVTNWRIPASAITLVAFNKRAEEEMRARTSDLRGLQIRTLNAIALAITNGRPPFAPQPGALRTLDEAEVRRIVQRLVRFPRRRNADPAATWIEALSATRLGLRSPEEVEARYDGEVDGFAAFVPRYRAALAEQQALDFDEQVHRAIEILLAEPAARAAAQRACRLLLVDEFQDLTPAHLLLVRLLAGADAAVFGVGDDDQTIYGYNGADPDWLIRFADHFPGAGDHPLHTNYRCPGGIVRAADTLLRHNTRRVAKRIVAARADDDGFAVEQTGDTVAVTVATITAARGRGIPAHDMAVLARVNSLLAPVQAALTVAGVPVADGVGPEFVDRAAVGASLAWLRLATGHCSPADIAHAVRRPARSLHPRVAEWVGEQSSVDALRRLAARVRTPKDSTAIEEFADDIEALQALAERGATTSELLDTLHRRTHLDQTIAGLDGHRHGMNRASQFDDVTALAQLAVLQPDPRGFDGWLRRTLAAPFAADGVTLATVHRVKGQEWPYVVVHHATADQFPHRLAEDIEEERRLFHVAITRAGCKVLVVPGDHPSPFVDECRNEPTDVPTARRSTAPRAAARPSVPAGDSSLFEQLRRWRSVAAAGKPAFTVLADAALREIAERRPSTLAELARVKGIGPAKLERYGDAILEVVRNT